MSNIYEYDGFQDLADIVQQYVNGAENAIVGIEEGVKEFVGDLLKLPKPMSEIKKAGYTHLVRSFTYRKKKSEIEVGWGKYYGPMIENGTKNMNAQPHVYPLWDKQKEKYYKTMLTKLGLKTW